MRSSFAVCVLLGVAGCGSSVNHGSDSAGVRAAPPVAPVTAAPATLTAATLAAALDLPAIGHWLGRVLPTAAPQPAAHPMIAATEAIYGNDVHSVRFVRATVLHKTPDAAADKVGIIGKDARAALTATAPGGHGCATRWLALAPRGWACETQVAPSREPPTAAQPVALGDGDDGGAAAVVPGMYGAVRGHDVQAFTSRQDALAGENARVMTGATSVRARGTVVVDGVRYWITTGGELIDAAAIAMISPSKFRGVALDDRIALPLAWAHGKAGPRAAIAIRGEPSPTAAITGELPARSVMALAETSPDGQFVRLADASPADPAQVPPEPRWIARGDLRVAAIAAPPPGTGADERWFDVDLDDQVLVAYEGTRPVYATLVSTGKWDHRTPSAIARVIAKHESANMVSEKKELYSVADVPWTMYYDHDFALHTAYWHDGFGDPRSHGCVNLAPRDARLLYHWSSPDVPPGWTAVYGDAETPGSLVRVRSRQTPDPAFRGYARTLHDRATLTAAN